MKEIDETYGRLWSVVTPDRNKARKIISEIEHGYGVKVNYKKDNRNELSVFFEDGVWLRWVRPTDNARGCRHGKLWCDKSVSYDDIELHILTKYYGKREDIVWF